MTKRRPPEAVSRKVVEIRGFVDRAGEPYALPLYVSEGPAISQTERDEIAKQSGINFLTVQDWGKIHTALHYFVRATRQTREGPDYDTIIARLEKIKAAGVVFMESVTVMDGVDEIAINLLEQKAGANFYGRVSGCVAETARGVEKAIQKLRGDMAIGYHAPNPMGGFVRSMAHIFRERGFPCTCSKAKGEPPKPSKFQNFMRLVLLKLPPEFQPNNLGPASIAAFMDRTTRELGAIRRSGKIDDDE